MFLCNTRTSCQEGYKSVPGPIFASSSLNLLDPEQFGTCRRWFDGFWKAGAGVYEGVDGFRPFNPPPLV